MKTFYKILFSICSTLVCTAHSFRAFAASCTLYSSAAIGSDDSIMDKGYTTQVGCTTYTTRYFVYSGYPQGETGRTYFAPHYDCTACATAYTKETQNIEHHNITAQTTCTLAPVQCIKTGCTKDADCLATGQPATKRVQYRNRDGTVVGYLDLELKCRTNKCEYYHHATSAGAIVINASTKRSGCDLVCDYGHYSHCGYLVSEAGFNSIYASGCVLCPAPEDFELKKIYWGATTPPNMGVLGGGDQ